MPKKWCLKCQNIIILKATILHVLSKKVLVLKHQNNWCFICQKWHLKCQFKHHKCQNLLMKLTPDEGQKYIKQITEEKAQ